ncbi:type II toxin-antitoxin system RelE family toxin [Methanoculleus receptaculi]|uniref:Uncharacterized protein n=1 Tax=Methanoculleus receptaculi TaxID=394967 RepID=A0AAX4FZ27_9EURY|nr:hypothetical protein [Methanoculleus receptaculi]WOX58621.1 hypothetical protein R6Y96_05165 [Methanoculleus receptaculi]
MFAILIERRAREFLKGLPPKTRRIVVEKIQELAENPFPGDRDKEKLEYPHPPAIYRLHISRSFTDQTGRKPTPLGVGGIPS